MLVEGDIPYEDNDCSQDVLSWADISRQLQRLGTARQGETCTYLLRLSMSKVHVANEA